MLIALALHLCSVQELFPLTRVEKKKEGESQAAAVWKERCSLLTPSPPHSSLPHSSPPHPLTPSLLTSSGLDLEAEAPPTKKSRVEDDVDFSMASLARGEVTEVSLYMDICHAIY